MTHESRPDGRQYHNTTSAYSLPNEYTTAESIVVGRKLTGHSNIEHARLEAQAQALEMLMFNNTFAAPVSAPKRILDVGCGTGRSTFQLAEKFPDAQIIGIDLSPVPALHPKPRNVEYTQGDVCQLVEAGKEPFEATSFDYVFSRLLSLGMTDWPGYFARISSILAQGGWFEVQEVEIGHRNADGVWITDQMPAMQVFQNLTAQKGLKPLIALEAPQLMRDCGLVNVHEKRFKVPFVEDPNLPQAAMISKQAGKLAFSLRSIWYKLGEGVYSREELDKLSQELVDEYANFKPGTYTNFVVITGRKETVDSVDTSKR